MTTTRNTLTFKTLGPHDVVALTGMTHTHIETLSSQIPPPTRPGPPTLLDHTTRVLLVLIALRTNLTERALAVLFGVSQPAIHRTITTLLPRLAALFHNHIPQTNTHLLLDGTLIPVHDQTLTAKSKNYRRSINTQIVATPTKHIIFIGKAHPGNQHDITVARATIHPPLHVTFKTDGGYKSFPHTITPPPRTQPKTRRRHIQVRARIEHILARLKDYQILRQCRRKGNTINHALHTIAHLHNLRNITT